MLIPITEQIRWNILQWMALFSPFVCLHCSCSKSVAVKHIVIANKTGNNVHNFVYIAVIQKCVANSFKLPLVPSHDKELVRPTVSMYQHYNVTCAYYHWDWWHRLSSVPVNKLCFTYLYFKLFSFLFGCKNEWRKLLKVRHTYAAKYKQMILNGSSHMYVTYLLIRPRIFLITETLLFIMWCVILQ